LLIGVFIFLHSAAISSVIGIGGVMNVVPGLGAPQL
jgi:hypothetical protein